MNIIDHLTNFYRIKMYIGNSTSEEKTFTIFVVAANDEVGTKNSIHKFDGCECVCVCYLLKEYNSCWFRIVIQ